MNGTIIALHISKIFLHCSISVWQAGMIIVIFTFYIEDTKILYLSSFNPKLKSDS